MTELRFRILRLLHERARREVSGIPTIGEVAEAVGEPLHKVSLVLKSSEAMGMIAIHRYMGTPEESFAVTLKPGAYVHLESQMED
jgi:predicted transcriptional regulator